MKTKVVDFRALAALASMLWGAGCGREAPPVPSPAPTPPAQASAPPAAPAQYAGSARCAGCHPAAYNAWKNSHHARAEQTVPAALLAEAFAPGKPFPHGTQQTVPMVKDGHPWLMAPGLSATNQSHRISHIIGVHPLLQFLAEAGGGRLQATEACWDPVKKEWFNVFGGEDRRPGEWGHWTGRGMNWNSMCAACHNTGVRKGYDRATDTYATTMVERGAGCESCHGPMQAHADWQEKNPGRKGDPTSPRLSPEAMDDACAACHSRRGVLDERFVAGKKFLDHFHPSQVDASDLWYPDGQVRDEDFEWAAFSGSRMHAVGIRCSNCHDVHAGKPVTTDNMLCLQCHSAGAYGAPLIQPVQHSFHALDSTGNQCVGCHMPVTNYMQRHPRHDHGFTVPDPLLTVELGIPNACNRCHTDKTAQWSLEVVEKWYGERMNKRPRARTRAIAAARTGDPAAREGLLSVLGSDVETPYWKSAAAGLLEPWAGEPPVLAALRSAASHTNALVRASALRAMAQLVEAGHPEAVETARAALNDPVRLVRFQAAWPQRAHLPDNSPAMGELRETLAMNEDQPIGRLQQGLLALSRGKTDEALKHYAAAADWDRGSAGVRHDYAVVLSTAGQNAEARQQMQAAATLEPNSAEYRYKLALAAAALGDAAGARTALEAAVALDPRHGRAWYNLGLARAGGGDRPGAIAALQKAEEVSPLDPDPSYALATLHLQANDTAAARDAAMRALRRDPGHRESIQLLRSLP